MSFQYPLNRLRRNRSHQWIRSLISETSLNISDLIQPVFVVEGSNKKILSSHYLVFIVFP